MDKKTCATCDKCSITLNATMLSEKPAPDTYICEATGIVTNPFAYCIDYSARREDGTGEPDCGTSLPTGNSHELAERIRMMYRWTPYIPFYVILQQAMREMLPEGTNYCEALADLIDRPTCTIIDSCQLITPGLEELDLDDMCRFKLSCGHDAYGYEEPKFCPECGAAIVNDR